MCLSLYVNKGLRTAKQPAARGLSACYRSYASDQEERVVSDDGEDRRTSHSIESGFLSRLRVHGHVMEAHRLNSLISCCAKSGSFIMGLQLHPVVIKLGLLSNVYICTSLLDLYGKRGEILYVEQMFSDMTERNVVSWNSLISSYLHVDCPETGIGSFAAMLRSGVTPSPFSVSAALACCSQLRAADTGAQLHGLCLKTGFDRGIVVGTGLVDMYSKCGNVGDSRQVFDQMQDKNVITWTSMVCGYAQNGHSLETMALLRDMLRLGIDINHVTYNSLLSSFSSPSDFEKCRQVHSLIVREGFDTNAYISVTVVTVYARCGASLEDFGKLCSRITIWDKISWNAVIAGLSNMGLGGEALKCFLEMRRASIDIDPITFQSILAVTGMISAIEVGKQLHALVLKTGYPSDVYVQNGLVSMYARCGAIEDSTIVFWKMDSHDIVSWNSLLSGCAHHGHGREAVELFEKMRETEVRPDGTTFLAVLSACSHSGCPDKGLEYFQLMKNGVSLTPPTVEHYAAIVDLLGRAGYLKEAEDFINSMPFLPGPSVYKALLSACQVHGNRDIALNTANKLLELWPDDAATYLLLSKVLIAEGHWNDVAIVRKLMFDNGVQKKPAYSWV